jgi:alcohol dehydrogenase class IV
MSAADAATQSVTWNYPTTVLFGPGGLRKLPRACAAAGITRPLLVTDPGVARLPVIAEARGLLAAAGLEAGLFAEVRPNPTGANVEAGIVALRHGDHDGVVAIGGGSALDAGKLIAFMAGQTRSIWDFEDVGTQWKLADAAAILPIIAVPTTAGTGSEVGRAGVVTDEATHTKRIIFHPKMMPATAILDAELTLGLPPPLTAATGMDALAHCLEAYCAPMCHPMAEGIAVEGLRLIKTALPRAWRDGADLDARGMMLAAAAMGAVAFQKGLGAVHSLSHPIGAVYDTHHGLTNAVVLPYVLRHNRPAIEAKLARLAGWLELPRGGFDGILEWILALRQELQVPHTLRELGVPDARLDELAAMAAVDPTAGSNPLPIDAATCAGLYRAAFDGTGC